MFVKQKIRAPAVAVLAFAVLVVFVFGYPLGSFARLCAIFDDLDKSGNKPPTQHVCCTRAACMLHVRLACVNVACALHRRRATEDLV